MSGPDPDQLPEGAIGELEVQFVEVVSAIDGKKLNATLGWIVKNIEELKGKDSGGKPDLEAQLKEQAEKLAALQKAHDEVNQSLKSRIDDLEKALGDLSDRTAGLEDKASAAENKLQEVDPEKLGELSKIDPEALRDAVERASQLPSSLSVLPGRLAALEAQAAALPRGILPAVETPPQPQSAPAGEPVPAHEADCRVDELAVALPELARRVESLEKAQKDTDDSLGPLRGLPDKVGRLSEEVEGAAARLNAAEGAVKEAHDVAAESLGAAEGAAKRAHEANERVSDIEDQMSQLRSALEALDKGEKVTLPPPIESKRPPGVDPDVFARLAERVAKLADELREQGTAIGDCKDGVQRVTGTVAPLPEAVEALRSDLAGAKRGQHPVNDQIKALQAAIDAAKGEIRWLMDTVSALKSQPTPAPAPASRRSFRLPAAPAAESAPAPSSPGTPAEAGRAETAAPSAGDFDMAAVVGTIEDIEARVGAIEGAIEGLRSSADTGGGDTAGRGSSERGGRGKTDGDEGEADLTGFVRSAVGGLNDRLDEMQRLLDEAGVASKRAAEAGRGAKTQGDALDKRLQDIAKALADKADKAQLDAVLQEITAPPPAIADDVPAPNDGGALAALVTEHARRLRALEASMAALRDQAGRAASGAEVADLASRLDGAREALEAADETAGRVAELQARLGALSRAVKGIQEEAASKEDLRPLAHLPGTLSSLTQEVGRLGTLGRKLDVEVTRLGSDVRRLNAVKADKGEGGGAQAPMDAPGGTERGPDDGGAAAGDIGSGFGGDWAEAAAEMREELGRAIGDMERQLGDAKKSVLETAYAVLLLTAGRRVDRHTARPGVGPGGDTDRGAGDLGVEDLPGGAGAQGTDGPVLSPLELLGDMLDRDMVHEKADKDALKRLADWVDEREATRAGAVSPEKLSVEDSAAEKDGRGADVRGEASVASVRGNGVADKTALDGARGADGADGMWAEQIKKLQEDMARLRRQVRGLTQGASKAVQQVSSSPFKFGEGDNAILSSKPIMGLRCMSCDRPLDDVQDTPGSYVVNSGFPARTSDVTRQRASTDDGRRSAVPGPKAKLLSGAPKSPLPGNRPTGASPDRRPPAERTPSHLVGPVLPPGGWRGNQEYVDLQSSPGEPLPAVGRGTSRGQLISGSSRANLSRLGR